MKSLEQMQAQVKFNNTRLMQSAMQKLEANNLNEIDKKAAELTIQNCQRNIENIEEVTTIEIGAHTNSIIERLQKAYQIDMRAYYGNFEKFVNDYVINNANFKNIDCYELGVEEKDLMCFKGQNPMDKEPGDTFRKVVNANYGTNIPMSDIVKQTFQEYQKLSFEANTEEQDKAFIHLKEVQRDAGMLKDGGTYYLLATNQQYLEAQARCSGPKL